MDLIMDLPLVEGFDSILVVVDQGLTKGVILVPCNKTITAEDTARLLLENLYKRLDFQTNLYLIEDPNLPQNHSKNFLNFLESNQPYPLCIIHKLMEQQNGLIKKLKLIC